MRSQQSALILRSQSSFKLAAFGTFVLFVVVMTVVLCRGGDFVVAALILIDLFRDVKVTGFSPRLLFFFFIQVLLKNEAPSMHNEAAAIGFKRC